MKQFPQLNIAIKPKFALQVLGYRKKSVKVPSGIMETIDNEMKIGQGLLRFRGVYAKYDCIVSPEKVELNNGYVIDSKTFAKRVVDCSAIYLFAVTAGPLFSERTSELIKSGDVSRALIADAVGSAAAECCAEAANKYISGMEKTHSLTKRYSPGYGDWQVADNRRLLKYLEADKVALKVNEGGLMIPEKSVSAAIGIISS